MHTIESICCLVIWPLDKLLPLKTWPVLTVCILFLVTYFIVEFIVSVMNVVTAYTNMSHFLVGLTLMVWGSDNMEMLNLAIAIGKGEEEMAMTALMSC